LKRKEVYFDLRIKVALGMTDFDQPILTDLQLTQVIDVES